MMAAQVEATMLLGRVVTLTFTASRAPLRVSSSLSPSPLADSAEAVPRLAVSLRSHASHPHIDMVVVESGRLFLHPLPLLCFVVLI